MTHNDTTVCPPLTLQQITAHDAELIIRNMRDTLYRVDAAGRLTYASPSAEELTGYTLQELMGKSVTDIYMHPEKRAEFIERLIAAKGQLNNYEVQLRHKKGHGVWVLINVRHFHDESGNVAGIEGLIRDIKRNSYFEKPSEKNRRKRKKSQRMARITSSNRI